MSTAIAEMLEITWGDQPTAVAARPQNTRARRIEALLDRVDGDILAELWRAVYPLPLSQVPGRRGLIADLADLAEVLSPSLKDVGPRQLCQRLSAYAAQRNQSQSFLRELVRGGQSAS
jgi:hypothetical protein